MNSLVRRIGGIQSEKHVFIVHLNDRWFDKHYIFRTFNSHHFMQPVLAKRTILSCPKRTCLITSDTITDCVLPFIYLPDDRPVSNIGQLVNQHVRQQFGALTASRYFHGKTRIFSQQKSQEWNVSYVGRYSSRKRPNIRRVWCLYFQSLSVQSQDSSIEGGTRECVNTRITLWRNRMCP